MKALAISLAVVMTASFVMPAYAATGTLYASGITAPSGTVWMGSSLWISDHLLGFCRLDPQPSGTYAINQTTCTSLVAPGIVSPGQPTYDAANKLVYVPDNTGKSRGVWRLTFDPALQTVGNPVVLAPTAGLGGNRPTATALGPDGSLYVGFIKSGNIVKINNPAGELQTVVSVGQSSDGRGISGLAFAGSDLYLAEGGAVTKIGPAGGKAVAVTGIIAGAPTAIASDGVDVLYIAETPTIDSTVLRYTISTNTNDILATSGRFPDLTITTFKFVSGLGLDTAGNLYIGDDPSDGVQVLQGHIWSIAAGSVPEVAGAGTPPPPPAMKQGVLNASGITAPAGGLWLGDQTTGHLWVSDHLLGLCRLDLQLGGTYAINQNTCNAAATSPGQPAYDATKNLIYVPDNSANSQGVWRLIYDPVTQTLGNAVLLAPTAGLGGIRPTTVALGPDGNLYVGFIKTGDIKRITNPSGTSQTVETFGKTSDGRGVSGITFVGPDLYLAEGAAVTRITGGGNAVPTFIDALAPTAIVSDGVNWIFVADTPIANTNILRYGLNPNTRDIYANIGVLPDGTTKPFQFVSGLAVDSMANLYIGDDPSDGTQVLQGHIWTVPGAFDDEYCHNPRGKDQPCRGNTIP